MNWPQLRTLLWLRWRLTRNQWGRAGQLNAVITLLVFWVGLCLAATGGIAGVFAGALALSKMETQTMMFVWDGLVVGFLFLWMIGLVAEIQRSELIDLGRLMHLPVSLRDAFVLNYLTSYLTFSIAIMLPLMLGLTLGLALGRGIAMVLLFPALLAFFFMVTAWTYCLRGWLASLMVNQRRRRAIIMGITLAFVLLGQAPNLVMNVWMGRNPNRHSTTPGASQQRASREREMQNRLKGALELAHRFVPVLWLPHAAKSLADGRVGPALLGAVGALGLGALGLRRAYRSTVRFYQGGDENKKAKAPRTPARSRVGDRLLVERELPLVPAEVAALALANLRSMTRAPEVKMALTLNVFIFGMMGAGFLVRGAHQIPEQARPLVASAAVAVTFLGLLQVLFNQFGFDRDGFRGLVLLPSPRRHILMGKNLSLLPVAFGVFAVLLGLMTVLARLSPLVLVAACLQFLAGFLALSVAGNLASILAPYRIAAGSLKPTKTKATTMLMIMVTQMMFPLATCPILLPAGLGMLCDHFGWLPGIMVNLAISVLLLAMAAILYWNTLEPLGRLLDRREQRILQVVTQEVE